MSKIQIFVLLMFKSDNNKYTGTMVYRAHNNKYIYILKNLGTMNQSAIIKYVH